MRASGALIVLAIVTLTGTTYSQDPCKVGTLRQYLSLLVVRAT